MKNLSLTLLGLLLTISLFAKDVKLKITYNGNGIEGHTVTVSVGGASLGSGVTNSSGEVTISVSSLPTNRIDVAGKKTCGGAQKSWDVKGYVTLDGSNYAHLKMEEPIAEMVEASGGFMSEKMMVATYGLVCSGSSSSSSNVSSNETSSSESSTSSSPASSSAEAPELMSRDEVLATQKTNFENKIANLDYKMEKKQSKIDDGKLSGDKKVDAQNDIEEMKIEKLIAQNDLDKVNLSMSKGMLNKAERNGFKDEEKRLKEELKELKAKHKSDSSSNEGEVISESKIDDDKEETEFIFVVTNEDLLEMSTMDLKKKKISLKTDLSKRKVKLKTRKKFLTPNELSQIEIEITKIEMSLDLIQSEIVKRGEE